MKARLAYREDCGSCRLLSWLVVALTWGTLRRTPLSRARADELARASRRKIKLVLETPSGFVCNGQALRLLQRIALQRLFGVESTKHPAVFGLAVASTTPAQGSRSAERPAPAQIQSHVSVRN